MCDGRHEVSRIRKLYTNQEKHPLLLEWCTTQTKLREAGVNFACGTWTKKERDILSANVNKYQEKNNIEDFKHFYHAIKNRTIVRENLYEELGENIFRVIRNIREKLDLLYKPRDENIDPNKEGKQFSSLEIDQLFKLQKIHGNNWRVISKAMGRSPSKLSMKYSVLRRRIGEQHHVSGDSLVGHVSDRFKPEEDEKLREAIEKYGKYENGVLNKKELDWNVIAAFVGNRTGKSCYQRWSIYLAKSREVVKEIGTKLLFTKAARVIYDADINDMKEVDWKAVVELLQVDVSQHTLRKVFQERLSTAITKSKCKYFRDVLSDVLSKYSFF